MDFKTEVFRSWHPIYLASSLASQTATRNSMRKCNVRWFSLPSRSMWTKWDATSNANSQSISRAVNRAKPLSLTASVVVKTVNPDKIKPIYCKVTSSELSLDWDPKIILFSSSVGVLQYQKQGPPFVEGTNKVHNIIRSRVYTHKGCRFLRLISRLSLVACFACVVHITWGIFA